MEAVNLESLNQRLRKLEDIEDIRRLRMQYHYLLNENLWERFPEIFTEDALVDFGSIGRAKGTAEIRELYLKIPKNLDLVKQFIHNHMVDVNGDDATGLSYLDARYARAGESVIVAAKFTEKYRRTPKGWKISECLVHVFFGVPITEGWASKNLHQVAAFK